nr:hypothetical protein GCM10020092_031790 [Actinoplanes digitatis]
MWGSGQHAAYVAANAYLNALAEQRRARGARATSISWGIWSDDVLLGRVDPSMIRRSGLVFMDPALALAYLAQAMESDDTVVTVADVDWKLYHPVFTSSRPTTLFEEVPEVAALEREAPAIRRRLRRPDPRAARGRAGPRAARPGTRRGRRRARPRLLRVAVRAQGVPRCRLRVADRRGPAQPPGREDRPVAAQHAGLRLPEPARPGRLPPRRARRYGRSDGHGDRRGSAPTSRSPSSAWAAATPVASRRHRTSGT